MIAPGKGVDLRMARVSEWGASTRCVTAIHCAALLVADLRTNLLKRSKGDVRERG